MGPCLVSVYVELSPTATDVATITLNTAITVTRLHRYIVNTIFNSAGFVERYKSH